MGTSNRHDPTAGNKVPSPGQYEIKGIIGKDGPSRGMGAKLDDY
jgi:hypothetical protein